MKRVLQILKLLKLIIMLPFDVVSTGSKKRAYRKIKKTMIAANLL